DRTGTMSQPAPSSAPGSGPIAAVPCCPHRPLPVQGLVAPEIGEKDFPVFRVGSLPVDVQTGAFAVGLDLLEFAGAADEFEPGGVDARVTPPAAPPVPAVIRAVDNRFEIGMNVPAKAPSIPMTTPNVLCLLIRHQWCLGRTVSSS